MIKLFSNSKEISLTKSSLESYAEGMNSYLKTGKSVKKNYVNFKPGGGVECSTSALLRIESIVRQSMQKIMKNYKRTDYRHFGK